MLAYRVAMPRQSLSGGFHFKSDKSSLILPLTLNLANKAKLIRERGLPKLKPVEIPLEFTLPDADCPAPRRALLEQAAEGAIPLDTAEAIIEQLPSLQKEKKPPEESTSSEYINTYLRHLVSSTEDTV